MPRSIIWVIAFAAALVVPGAAEAYPSNSAEYPAGQSRTDCTDCHAASEAGPLASVRKGPHGGYTAGTSRCLTCHAMHDAVSSEDLLPAQTISDVCISCHDGTGGGAVYGVIKARTGQDPGASHRIEQTAVIPGGGADGGDVTRTFSGPNGTLTCIDCHSPHDSRTVEPFLGDRLRSSETSDTGFGIPTSRLLRQAPTGAETTVTAYGVGWCASCHQGRPARHAEGSGVIEDHPVAPDDTYTYGSAPVVRGVGSTETELGSLGQSNRGYVMPGPSLSEPTLKTPLQEGRGPLCQQCHEDAREVGPAGRYTNPTLTGASQEFRVTTYGEDASPYDNPRFQLFPHETENPDFLVRAPEPAEPNNLCLNCHSLLHNATLGSGYVEVFEGAHDSASTPSGDGIDASCGSCHTAALLPVHGDRCTTCHPGPYDTLTPSWSHGCQQGGCHTTYHDGTFNAHWDAYDNDPCTVCHPTYTWWPTITQCLNCHASAGSTVAPVTLSNAQPSYGGAGRIDFTITKGGKAAIGTTFYRIDDGETMTGGSAVVSTPGTHTIEYWSVDQNGLTETPSKSATFTITGDTAPPVTTSNASPGFTYYYNTVYITLTASDAGSLGVKATYYSLDGGPTQTGTRVTIPAASGTFPHTLEFWSEDWSGNIEPKNSVSFTVIGGKGTVRFGTGTLLPGEWVEWQVWRGTPSGSPHYTVYHEYPFSGYEDLLLPVSGTDYYIREAWGTDTEPYDEHNWGYYPVRTPDTFIQIP